MSGRHWSGPVVCTLHRLVHTHMLPQSGYNWSGLAVRYSTVAIQKRCFLSLVLVVRTVD